MFSSSRYSSIFLRFGLALVFLWFGIDKMIHVSYWTTVWIPPNLFEIIGRFGISQNQLIYGAGFFEILTGLSLLSSVFAKFFSLLAILYLIAILILNGLSEITVRDIGLIGGLLAVLLWPNFRSRY